MLGRVIEKEVNYMKRIINILSKLIIMVLFFYTWRSVQVNDGRLNITYVYFYLILVISSFLSDKYFYRGQKTENKKEHEITSYYLSLTWFITLIVPVLEYAYMIRYNIASTIIGSLIIISGTIIRGVGIKTLGSFFSRDVETWDNQKIIKTGIYNYIRHPAYAGNILQAIGFPLVLNAYFSLILSVITIIGFIWRIEVEKKFLIKKLPGYREYIQETKKIMPKIW